LRILQPFQRSLKMSAKVKVYDIDKAVKEFTEGKFQAFGYDNALAIIEGSKGIIVSNCDGVHKHVLDNEDQIRILMVENTESKSIPMFPSHSADTSVAMLKSLASYTEMKLTEFIRRFGSRIESNYDSLLKSIKEIGLNPADYPREI